MTDEDKIENGRKLQELVTNPPPKTKRPRKQLVVAVIRDVAAVVAFISFALGGVLYYQQSHVYYQQSHVGTCVNGVLNDRAGPNAADKAAQYAFLDQGEAADQALAAAFEKVVSGDRAAAISGFQSALRMKSAAKLQYQSALRQDDADRAAHPLGKC